MTDIIEICLTIDADSSHLKASQLLANHTNLSQAKIKDAMQKGAVWLLRGKSKRRLRRASKPLLVGDKLELNYNTERSVLLFSLGRFISTQRLILAKSPHRLPWQFRP